MSGDRAAVQGPAGCLCEGASRHSAVRRSNACLYTRCIRSTNGQSAFSAMSEHPEKAIVPRPAASSSSFCGISARGSPAPSASALTRLLAKIASELQKPDGLTVLDPAELPRPAGASFPGRPLRNRTRNALPAQRPRHSKHPRVVGGSTGGRRSRSGARSPAAIGGPAFTGTMSPNSPRAAIPASHASVLDPRFRNDHGRAWHHDPAALQARRAAPA